MKSTRNYFLTINKNAECFTTYEENLKEIKGLKFYAYITHKKNQEQEHIHLILVYESARTTDTLRRAFKGSHIEPMASIETSCKYLLHINRNSRSQGKEQYKIEEIKTNDLTLLKSYIDKPENIKLTDKDMWNYFVDNDFNYETIIFYRFSLLYGLQSMRYEKMFELMRRTLMTGTLEEKTYLQTQMLNQCDIVNRNNFYERQGQIFDKEIEKKETEKSR